MPQGKSNGETTLPINCALIGLGYWGKILFRNLILHEKFLIHSLADLNIAHLNPFHHKYPHLKLTDNVSEVFEDKHIDAVIIATGASSHYSLVRQALLSDKHVLVEKPFTCSSGEAFELYELSVLQNKVLMIDHILLYSDATQTILKNLKEQKTSVQSLDFERLNQRKGQSEVNVLWDLGPYDLAVAQHVVNEAPYSVQVISAETRDLHGISSASFVLNYESGKKASFRCAWFAEQFSRRALFSGENIRLHYDESEAHCPCLKMEKRSGENKSEAIHYYPVTPVLSPVIRMLNDFAASVHTGTTPLSCSATGVMITRIIEALNTSAENHGKEVELKSTLSCQSIPFRSFT